MSLSEPSKSDPNKPDGALRSSPPPDGAFPYQTLETLLGIGFLCLSLIVLADNIDMGVWADELWTIKYASPLTSFIENYRQWGVEDAHPPFFSFLLHLWFQVAPFTDVSARIFDIGIYVAAMLVCYRIAGPDEKQLALRFIVLNSSCFFVLYYLLEIRSYAILPSLSACCAWCFHTADSLRVSQEHKARARKWLPAFLFLLSLPHLWGILFAGSIFLVTLFRRDWRRDRTYVLSGFLALALASPFYILITYYIISGMGPGLHVKSFIASDVIGIKLTATIIFDLQEQLLRTLRSKLIFVLCLALVIWFAGWRHTLGAISILLPVVTLICAVSVISLALGSFYRSYALVVVAPFVFLAVAKLIATERLKGAVSVAVFVGFVAANFGSVPFFEEFPEKPSRFQVIDDKIVESLRKPK